MRVLQLIDSLEAGGAERVAVNLANSLTSRIERSFLCATRKEGILKSSISKDVEYLFLDKQRTLDFKAILKVLRYIKHHKINIIRAHSSSFFLATLAKLRYRKIKIVWHDHYGKSEFLNERATRVLNLCSRHFSYILVVNSTLETWAKQRFKNVPVSYLSNFAIKNSLKSKTVLKGETGKRILQLANLRPQKDHVTMLKAFKLILVEYPNWTLHLVGKDFNDNYLGLIKQTIATLKLQESVFIYGSREDVDAIIKQSTIGVLSSVSEGLPIALIEYGLYALPVVATNVGDCERVIKNGETGCLVASKNEEYLAQAVILLIKNEALRLTYSRQLHAHISANFSEKVVITQLVSIYKRCLS